jgi:hypothetical protein
MSMEQAGTTNRTKTPESIAAHQAYLKRMFEALQRQETTEVKVTLNFGHPAAQKELGTVSNILKLADYQNTSDSQDVPKGLAA